MSKTCGELYQEALNRYADEETWPIFAAGFIYGQAEKVANGVCPAAMFRPSEEKRAKVLAIAREVAGLAGLVCCIAGSEIWLYRAGSNWSRWLEYPENSPEWHRLRAEACGIPPHLVDVKYHEREAFNQPCDTIATKQVCTCHERDGSVACPYCRSQGIRGHMEGKP